MNKTYNSDELFSAIDGLSELATERQGFAAWRYIARAENEDSYQVALDFAAENGMIPSELVMLMRSDTRGGAINSSWLNPVGLTQLTAQK
ncbi:MAG: hypothetical protein ACI9G1_001703 [Pirellulaceae bacterium]